MKTIKIIITIVLLISTIASCKKEEPKTIYDRWEVVSNSLDYNDEKYFIINDDKIIDRLYINEFGFKSTSSSLALITEDQISIGYFGARNYILEEDKLTLIGLDDYVIVLKRNSSSPTKESWIKSLGILSEGSLPWSTNTGDIAFDGSHIVYGSTGSFPHRIAYINTNTFNMDREESPAQYAIGVAVEKSSAASRLIFQSNGIRVAGYTEDTNMETYSSDVFESGVRAIATLDADNYFVLLQEKLLLYKYTAPSSIIKTFEINRSLSGMTYQNGFLYACRGKYIYKCEINSTFKVLETYRLDNSKDSAIKGITFDGTNFWVTLDLYEEDSDKLMKIDLSI